VFARFFIDRPIFAAVLSIVIIIVGVVALVKLPIAQYPEVAPPTVNVTASYPGASAKVAAETVATPIELEINGVEDMMYMSSKSTNDGQVSIDVTFKLGTNLDMAQVLVQNRVGIAEAKLPEEVKRQGVTTKKKSPSILLCVNLISPNDTYDQLYLSNYATLNVKDELARIEGVGDVAFLGPRDYSMRVWLDPEKLKGKGLAANDVVRAIREQNVQVAAGRLGQPPVPTGQDFQMTINTLGRLDEEQFKKITVKTGEKGEVVSLKEVARDDVTGVTLDPERLAAQGLTARDVERALQAQRIQAKLARFPVRPAPAGPGLQLTITAPPERVGDRVVKDDQGHRTTLKDVARAKRGIVELEKGIGLEAKNADVNSYLDGQPATTLAIFQLPGSNAVKTADDIKKKMDELAKKFPNDLEYRVVYDTTVFINESITSVYHTLFEAIILVFLVVLVFLQTWRATLIPMIAVPVSLIGTFAVMALLGFSLNNLSLFGLVLAIGIVVDDAIVVVENVERNLALGLNPRDATRKAMDEVSGPVIAIALVLCAVFVPTAFMAGISGQFYKQFALTIAASTIISAFNSLTLSPALCALMLKGHHAKKDVFTRVFDLALGWFFKGFNWVFDRATELYGQAVGILLRLSVIVLLIYGGLIALTLLGFRAVPTGFIPQQDKGYLVVNAQLPDGSSLERTDAVVDGLAETALHTKGVAHVISLPGYAIITSTNIPNSGGMFVILDPFEERKGHPELSADSITAKLRQSFSEVEEAQVVVFGAPPIDGLGSTGGFKMQIKDYGGGTLEALQGAVQNTVEQGNKQPELVGLFSTFSAGQPQLYLDVDRAEAKAKKVSLTDLFDTLQIYLGSAYVNDITLLNRNWQVIAQADARYRLRPENIGSLQVRNADGAMVPLSTLVRVRDVSGPAIVNHYNTKPSAEISGNTAPGVGSGEAITLMDQVAKSQLPQSMGYEWTELTYLQIDAEKDLLTKLVFPLAVVFVFLTLSAQYESWSLPLAIILIVPMCLLAAIAGVWLAGSDNNIFTQIGLVVLIGLASKNAILIVEFAKERQEAGLSRFDAALEASRLRLRPILMTSFAFILGVVPLVLAKGAGAEMRQALGIAVFSGMLGVTLFGIFFTPVFYVVIRWFSDRLVGKAPPAPAHEPTDDGVVAVSADGGPAVPSTGITTRRPESG
jgi:hydrophobe/amphiphile efflux-1 (HAE1) family protein